MTIISFIAIISGAVYRTTKRCNRDMIFFCGQPMFVLTITVNGVQNNIGTT